MNVVVLIGNEAEVSEKRGPKSFILTTGSVSLIEYLVRTLRLLGVKPKEIIVVTGQAGGWRDKAKHDLLSRLGILEVSLPTGGKRSFSSLRAVLKMVKGDLLVLNGDQYFELDEIENLLSNKAKSSALVESRNYIALDQKVINISNGLITDITSQKVNLSLPWFAYHGAMFFKAKDVSLLTTLVDECDSLSYLEVAVKLAKLEITAVCPQKSLDGSHHVNKTSLELTGGSFAGLSRSLVVKKFADKTGFEKLKNEILWLKKLDRNIGNKFPEVLDFQLSDCGAWYTMPWYQYENLRKKVITGKITIAEFDRALRKVLNFLWENLYSQTVNYPDINWVNRKHFSRFYDRLHLISNIRPLDEMLKLQRIIIDGVEYDNLPQIIGKVKEYSDRYSCFMPKQLVMIHGDLHLQNILVSDDAEDFILADPRGELDGSDIFYDLGKLWHSFNGKYDLIHTDIAHVLQPCRETKNPEYALDFGPAYLIDLYKQIGICVKEIMNSYPISQEQNWMLKTHFNEFMHFSSLMCFHLFNDQIENRSVALYLQAVKLGNDLISELRSKYDC